VDLRPFYELLTRETLIFSDLAAEGAASPPQVVAAPALWSRDESEIG